MLNSGREKKINSHNNLVGDTLDMLWHLFDCTTDTCKGVGAVLDGTGLGGYEDSGGDGYPSSVKGGELKKEHKTHKSS